MTFENVEYNSIKKIYYLCKDSEHNSVDMIRYLYNNDFSYFDENLFVCKHIKIIYENKNRLFCTDYESCFDQHVINGLLNNRHSLGTLADFINMFAFEDGSYIYRISNQEKILFMWERHFLNDLGIICLQNDVIFFNDKYTCLLPKKRLTLDELKNKIKGKEEIGIKAEIFVVNYEMKKLLNYPKLPQNCVQQVSDDFVNAGYDIESFDKEAATYNKYKKIYIEVKCVNSNYLFYWSRNEIDAAKKYRSNYFLYLVPSTFEDEGLKIIQDPVINVLNNDFWLCETEQLKIRENYFGNK